MQKTDATLVRHLEERHIPFVTFDGAEELPGDGAGGHWTPEGHKLVAERLFGLLSANHLVGNQPRASHVGGVPR
jgi:hypothetical protein